MPFYDKKCPYCHQWTDGNQPTCSHCGKRLFEQQEREFVERVERTHDFSLPLIKIKPNDHFIVKFFKYIIQFAQVIYFGLIWFIVYFSTVVVG